MTGSAKGESVFILMIPIGPQKNPGHTILKCFIAMVYLSLICSAPPPQVKS